MSVSVHKIYMHNGGFAGMQTFYSLPSIHFFNLPYFKRIIDRIHLVTIIHILQTKTIRLTEVKKHAQDNKLVNGGTKVLLQQI